MGWKKWNGKIIENEFDKSLTRAVQTTGDAVMALSKQQVPLDEGLLLRSGIVIVKHENVPIAIISFGGGSGTGHPIVPYAIKWHETQANFQHGRKWKYLKDPFNQIAAKRFLSEIEKELKNI